MGGVHPIVDQVDFVVDKDTLETVVMDLWEAKNIMSALQMKEERQCDTGAKIVGVVMVEVAPMANAIGVDQRDTVAELNGLEEDAMERWGEIHNISVHLL